MEGPLVFGAAHKTTGGQMIYQYNSALQIIAEYPSLKEAERITGILEKTISSATLRGGLCKGVWYFSRKTDFVPQERLKGEKAGNKFTVIVSDGVWDRLLVAIGQRKKQDIFRNLLLEWLENEERQHDRKSN